MLFLSMVDGPTYDKLKDIDLTNDEKKSANAFCKTFSAIVYTEDDVRDLRFSLMSMRQKDTESVADFADRLHDTSSKAFADDAQRSSNQLTAFLQGIYDPKIKLKLYESSCSTFIEAVKLAKRIESAQSIINTSTSSNTADDIFAVNNNGTSDSLPRNVSSDRNNRTSNSFSSNPPRTEGNTDSNYSNPPRMPMRNSQTICWNCNRVGHISRNCYSRSTGNQGSYQHQSRPRNTTYNQPRFDRNQGTGQMCSYCKMPNHGVDRCYKLQRDMSNNSFQLGASQAGPSSRT